jgi:competence protein ComFB
VLGAGHDLKGTEEGGTPMSLSERYDMGKLVNRSAEVVCRKIEQILDMRDDICRCEDCVLDLVAYTLNRVKPLYGTSLLGPLHPDRVKETELEERIERTIEAGLKKIARHPHHAGKA